MPHKQIIKVSGSTVVNQNVDIAFNFFVNPGNDALWRTEINKSTVNGALQKGVSISEYSNLSKKAPNNLLELQCVQFVKNRIAIFETGHDAPFYLRSQREVNAVSNNSTEIIYQLEFDLAIVKFAMGFSLPKFLVSLKAKGDMKK